MATKSLKSQSLGFSAFAETASRETTEKPTSIDREKFEVGVPIEGMLIEVIEGNGQFGPWSAARVELNDGSVHEYWLSHEDVKVKVKQIVEGSPIGILNKGKGQRAFHYFVATQDDNGNWVEVKRDFS